MADSMTDRINALSGGAPLPQAATATIARRLLGPALADRYGDVLGIRPTGVADVARDFSIGMVSGDPTKADQLKAQLVQGYNREKRQEETDLARRQGEARQQLTGFFNLMSQGKTVPKELRKDFFEEGFKKLGYEVTSPLLMKVVTNYEKFGNIYDSLSDPMVQQLADDDPLPAQQRLIELGYDGAQVIEFTKQVQEAKRYRAGTQQIIAQTKKIGLAQEDPNAKNRAAFIGRMAGRQVKDRLGRSRLLSPDEIGSMADRFFPTGAPPVEAQPAPEPAGLPQGTTSASTTVTPTTTGITSVPAASAAPPRKLAGSVTRLE